MKARGPARKVWKRLEPRRVPYVRMSVPCDQYVLGHWYVTRGWVTVGFWVCEGGEAGHCGVPGGQVEMLLKEEDWVT